MLKKIFFAIILSIGIIGCINNDCDNCNDCTFKSTTVVIRTSSTTKQTESYGFNQENYVWESWQFSTNRVNSINR